MKQIHIVEGPVEIRGVGTFNTGWADFTKQNEEAFVKEWNVPVDTYYDVREKPASKTTTKKGGSK